MPPVQTVIFIVAASAAVGIAILMIQDVFRPIDQNRANDQAQPRPSPSL
jgi:hypothetical protein